MRKEAAALRIPYLCQLINGFHYFSYTDGITHGQGHSMCVLFLYEIASTLRTMLYSYGQTQCPTPEGQHNTRQTQWHFGVVPPLLLCFNITCRLLILCFYGRHPPQQSCRISLGGTVQNVNYLEALTRVIEVAFWLLSPPARLKTQL